MSTEKILAGKVALVTGGTSGIGESSAALYAKAGAKVIVTGRSAERGKASLEKLKQAGDVSFFQGDISNEDDIKRMMAFVLDTYGRLDIAFNNAGMSGPIKKMAELELSEWQEVQNTDLTSVWLCMKYQILQMIEQGGGVIVNHASLAGLTGMPFVTSYCAAKHGVVGLTKTAALEYVDDGIRVNAICPGSIDTPLLRNSAPAGTPDAAFSYSIPMRRLGLSTEVAELVFWLSSPQSAFVTGQAIAIDGGESTGRPLPPQA